MKKIMFIALSLLAGFFLSSCSDNEMVGSVVSNTAIGMEILSRFIDVNETTNEYYINENKRIRALSYVTNSDWQDLEKVSLLSMEKCKGNLQTLNSQVANAITNPNITYMVFSVNGKTFVKKVKDDVNFDFNVY